MRIAIAYNFNDSTWLGGRNYFSSLFAAVRAVRASDVEFVLVAGHKTVTTLPEQFPQLEVVRTSLMDRLSPLWAIRQLAHLSYKRKCDPLFGRLLRERGIDVLSHSAGLGKNSGVRSLGWLPDFQFIHLPDYWTPKQLQATHRTYNDACENCDEVIVSSYASLQDLRAFAPHCAIPAHVLHFAPVAFDAERLKAKSVLIGQYQLPADYFHLPNQFWAHKNHGLVIDALALLKEMGSRATVVCTGSPTDIRRPEYFESLMARCRTAQVEADFRVLGLVPYLDMQALMAHSLAVINPSRFEGWSTTVEEAKAFGKRVLLSDIPVHREQAPSDSAYFAPDSAESLATLMRATLRSEPSVPAPEQISARNAAARVQFGEDYLRLVRSS